MTSGIFWNLEIGNREIWKIPEIGWFGPILIFWVYFPLSLGHWAWLWSQNCKIPIFLEFCQKFSGNLEIPRNWLVWTNFDILGIFPTQFRSQSMIVKSEFQNSNFSGILPEIFWKSGNSQILADLDQFGCTGYHFHSVFVTDLNFQLRTSRFQLFCNFSSRNFPEIWKFSIFMQFQCIGHHLQLIFVTEVDLELYSEFGISNLPGIFTEILEISRYSVRLLILRSPVRSLLAARDNQNLL